VSVNREFIVAIKLNPLFLALHKTEKTTTTAFQAELCIASAFIGYLIFSTYSDRL